MKDFNKTWEKLQKAVQKSEMVSEPVQPSFTRVSSTVIKRK